MSQQFGGIWTKQKLQVLERYLVAYKNALKYVGERYGWQLIYIDAFAGSGQCEIDSGPDNDCHSVLDDIPDNVIDGSARIAVNIELPFDHYYFVEHKKKYFKQLSSYCDQHPLCDRIHIKHGDANEAIEPLLQSINWKNTRGVMFLDPFGMQVGHKLLTQIANTRALDVWYLFPLSGIYRQAANNYEAVDASKEAALNRCLGTDRWKSAFYETIEPIQCGLFDFEEEASTVKTAGLGDIIQFVKSEVLENVFPAVSEPKILYTRNNAPQFALFFAVSNPDQAAIKPAMNIADYILNM